MSAHLYYLVYYLTKDPGYPLAMALIVIGVLINLVVFMGALSSPVCHISIMIIDIALVLYVLFIFFKKRNVENGI